MFEVNQAQPIRTRAALFKRSVHLPPTQSPHSTAQARRSSLVDMCAARTHHATATPRHRATPTQQRDAALSLALALARARGMAQWTSRARARTPCAHHALCRRAAFTERRERTRNERTTWPRRGLLRAGAALITAHHTHARCAAPAPGATRPPVEATQPAQRRRARARATHSAEAHLQPRAAAPHREYRPCLGGGKQGTEGERRATGGTGAERAALATVE